MAQSWKEHHASVWHKQPKHCAGHEKIAIWAGMTTCTATMAVICGRDLWAWPCERRAVCPWFHLGSHEHHGHRCTCGHCFDHHERHDHSGCGCRSSRLFKKEMVSVQRQIYTSIFDETRIQGKHINMSWFWPGIAWFSSRLQGLVDFGKYF